jgi:ankyrin repeat protein
VLSSQQCLNILRANDFEQILSDIKASNVAEIDGQRERFSNIPSYTDWKSTGSHHYESMPDNVDRLWVRGSKHQTTLAIFAIEELQRLQGLSGTRQQVLYFFCNVQENNRRTSASILQELLRQLMSQRPDLCYPIQIWLSGAYTCFNSLDNTPRLGSLLYQALRDPRAGTTYCILGGLDQCDEPTITEITKVLAHIFSSPDRDCGSHESEAREHSPKLLITSADPPTSDGDKFGQLYIDKKRDKERAPLAGDDLCNKTYQINIEEAFHGPHDYSYKPHVLMLWTLSALFSRPTAAQLALIMNIPESKVRTQLKSCTEVVGFCHDKIFHHSKSEFLRFSKHPQIVERHQAITTWCLEYLASKLDQLNVTELETLGQIDATDPMLLYAARYWADHVKSTGDSSDRVLQAVLKAFKVPDLNTLHMKTAGVLRYRGTRLHKWWILYCGLLYRTTAADVASDLLDVDQRPPTTPLHVFAYTGLHELLRTASNSPDWLLLVDDIDENDLSFRDPLAVAINRKHADIFELLMAHRSPAILYERHLSLACCDTRMFDMVNPHYDPDGDLRLWMHDLVVALVQSDDEALPARVLDYIKTKHPDCFPMKQLGEVALALIPIWRGLPHLVTVLTSITSLSDNLVAFNLPLQAARYHDLPALKALLALPAYQHRYSAPGMKKELSHALIFAIEYHCAPMIDILVHAENAWTVDPTGHTPLHFAVHYGNAYAVSNIFALFDAATAPPVSQKDTLIGAAMNLLIYYAHTEQALEALALALKKGGRIRYDQFGITAFHVAAVAGNAQALQVLHSNMSKREVERSLDDKATSLHSDEWEGKTALAVATHTGHVDAVRLLVKWGAKTGCVDKGGKTALELAREAGHDEVVEVLAGKARKKKKGRR